MQSATPTRGNRKSLDKPEFLETARKYLISNYRAIVSSGEEADDLIGIAATKAGPLCVVASADKDMLQLPAYHFNFNKNEWKTVDIHKGNYFFYTQVITGDAADNIKGLYRVGPVKAEKILKGSSTEEELWIKCVEAYEGDVKRATENGKLLWLRRYEGEIWEPPEVLKQKED